MLRVLHCVSGMGRGGIETFIMNVYRNIDRKKVQFDFLVHTDKECAYDNEIRSLGGKIFSIPSRNQGVLKNRNTLNTFFKAHPEYKVVHQHLSSLTYVEPLKVAKKHGVPVRIIHSHNTRQGGNFLHKYLHYWNQLFVQSYATHYLACSDLAARWLYGKKQYKLENYQIINNGIETDKFTYNLETRNEARKEFNFENKLVFGHIGRFSPQKNHTFIIDIFKSIKEQNDDSVLILVGDGENRTQIEQKIRDFGLQDSVVLTGVRSDISSLLQAMDVFIMPSHYEGLPVTLVEAQATGLPCIVSDNITKQVAVTNFIEYVDLTLAPSYWRGRVLTLLKGHTRQDTTEKIKDAGFDIKDISIYLQSMYSLGSR